MLTCRNRKGLRIHRRSSWTMKAGINVLSLNHLIYHKTVIKLFKKKKKTAQNIRLEILHHLKYWCICIFVYSYDDLWISHSCQVLNSSWNPKSNIQLRSNDFPSLTNLKSLALVRWETSFVEAILSLSK